MVVHVVLFRAYDSNQSESFFNKTTEEIHNALFEICPTYITIGIMEFKEFEHLPVSMLENFHRPEHREYKESLKKINE